jgi:hypothetical protein
MGSAAAGRVKLSSRMQVWASCILLVGAVLLVALPGESLARILLHGGALFVRKDMLFLRRMRRRGDSHQHRGLLHGRQLNVSDTGQTCPGSFHSHRGRGEMFCRQMRGEAAVCNQHPWDERRSCVCVERSSHALLSSSTFLSFPFLLFSPLFSCKCACANVRHDYRGSVASN